MHLKFNETNHITIDPNQGCRIEQLTLGGKTIIKSIQNEAFLGSASYLMFPWVNRIVENPYSQTIQHQFTDGKGYPLHGLYVNTKRQVNVKQIKEQQSPQLHIKVSDSIKAPNIHGFQQLFILGQNWLQIQFNVLKSNQDPNPYCFGYHPYFQMSKPLTEIKISSSLDKQLVLQQDLLMRWPKQHKEWNGIIDGKDKYDSLFQGAEPNSEDQLSNFVELDDGSNLRYWQIYTPEDGMRIAIEPMSFHGNVYQICKQKPQIKDKLPKSGKIRITVK